MKTSRKEYNGKTLAVVVAALAAVLMLFWAGCTMGTGGGNGSKDDLDDKKETESASGVDYEDYSTSDYVVKVKNNTTKSLVVFKGEPSAANLMGGVPASATNHGLKKNSSMFADSSDFVLFFVTEEDYLAHKDNLSNLKTKPFARLYAYYNTNAKNQIVYSVSNDMGGTGKLNLNNNTPYNVELRKDSIYGEVIGYTSARTINTTFSVQPGDYYIFPVFRKFDKTLNEIVTVYPKDKDGDAYVEVLNITDSKTMELNASRWSENVTFTSGYAYLKIKNESSTGISLYDGANSAPVLTSSGGAIINSGDFLVYQIPMTQISGEHKFTSSETKGTFKFGNALKNDNKIDSKSYEAGKLYTYVVSGEDYKSLSGKFDGEPVLVDDGFEITN